MAVTVKTKQWGNSLGIIIPKVVVDELSIAPGEEIVIEVKEKQNVLKELFGAISFKRKTKDLLKDVRKDLESKWM